MFVEKITVHNLS